METLKRLLLLLLFLLSCTVAATGAYPKPTTHRFPVRRWQQAESIAGSPQGALQYETKYYTQTLDHFNYQPQGYATFQQRYLVNDQHWGGAALKAPIFVYTGNEGDIELFTENTGFLLENAPHFNAMVVFIEHRYYGKSIPFGDMDVAFSNTSTLGYLSSTQALADYATLIIDMKKTLHAEASPVVAFGGSYGGLLAAWFRLKYPHIVIGSLASSSPILLFDDIVSPYAFRDIITRDYRGESESCYETIKRSWKEIEDVGSGPQGGDKLEKAFRICTGKASVESVQGFLDQAIVYGAMMDYPTPANLLTPLPAYPVREMCKAIDNPSTGNNTFSKIYGALNIYYNHTGTMECFTPSSTPKSLSTDSWNFQVCTEMILPISGSSNDSIFPPSTYNYTYMETWCESKYQLSPRPHWITTEFGGHNIRTVLRRFGSNIIFFNGLRDPCSGGGVLNSLSKSLIAIVAPEGAHHVDLRFSTEDDPDWLKNVRRREVKIIERWLNQYYTDLALL